MLIQFDEFRPLPTISAEIQTQPNPESVSDLYLDLLKRSLTRALIATSFDRHHLDATKPWKKKVVQCFQNLLAGRNVELVRLRKSEALDYTESGHETQNRMEDAETMLGLKQLDNMQYCVSEVLRNRIPGDLLEAGVWRGGMTIFMRGLLKANEENDRRVWVVDSFEGLPAIDQNRESFDWHAGDMAVSLEEVQSNFARYGLLDKQVVFLKGYFNKTLGNSPIRELAILRIDADLYQSTMDALIPLYPKLSPGGFAIFDDYSNLPDCQRAIHDYRDANGITEEICKIDQRAVYWKKMK